MMALLAPDLAKSTQSRAHGAVRDRTVGPGDRSPGAPTQRDAAVARRVGVDPSPQAECDHADVNLPVDPLDPSRASARRELFGGKNTVRVWDLGALTPPFTAVLFCELEPGGRVGAHRQEHDDEVVVVVAGEAVLYVDGRAHGCVPGGAVALPRGSLLEIDNASVEAPVRYLIVKARSSPA
jgi:quercetin dioxygenase-like cupin family protein